MSRYYKYGGYKLSESCNRDCSKQKACDDNYHLSSSGSGNCVPHDVNPNLYSSEKYKLLNNKFTAPVFPALDLPQPPSEFPTSQELQANPDFNEYMNERLSNPEPEFGGGSRTYRKKSKSSTRRKSRSKKRKTKRRSSKSKCRQKRH